MITIASIKRCMTIGVLLAFLSNGFGPVRVVHAEELVLPKPGQMVPLSPKFIPAHLTGMTIHPDNALQFDFLIDRGMVH